MGKQRPRMCRINGRNVVYTPQQTVKYEKLVKASYVAESKIFFNENVPLEISIMALFPVPKSKSNGQKHLMLSGAIFPTRKPDSDNIIKIILDALNGVAYHDDSQVCKIFFEKRYAEVPEVKVIIKEIEIYENNKNL